MKMNKILAVIWVLIALFLCFIMVERINSSSWSWKKGVSIRAGKIGWDYGNSGNEASWSYSASGINSIDVDVSSSSVRIEETEGNNVEVEVRGFEEDEVNVATVDGTLKVVTVKKNNVVVIGFSDRSIVVKVPASCNLKELDLDSSSGSIHVSDLAAEKIDIMVSSGSVQMENVSCKNSLDVKSHSGSIRMSDVSAPSVDLNSSSGSVKFVGECDKFNIKSTSGSVRAELTKPFFSDSEIRSTSGSIHLDVPNSSNFNVAYRVASGSYRNAITGCEGKKGSEKVGSGGPMLDISATSGSIKIE